MLRYLIPIAIAASILAGVLIWSSGEKESRSRPGTGTGSGLEAPEDGQEDPPPETPDPPPTGSSPPVEPSSTGSKLRDSDPAPRSGRRIRLTGSGSWEGFRVVFGEDESSSLAVSRDGSFELPPGWRPGTPVRLRRGSSEWRIRLPGESGSSGEVELSTEGDELRLRVFDSVSGDGIAGARVDLTSEDPEAPEAHGRTDGEGRLALPFLPQGSRYRARVDHPDHTPAFSTLISGADKEWIIELSPRRDLEVEILGHEAYPAVEWFRLLLTGVTPPATGGTLESSELLEASGRFLTRAPPPGTWRAELSPVPPPIPEPSLFPTQVAILEVEEGEEPLTLTFTLPGTETARVSGRVLNVYGEPVTEGSVSIANRSVPIAADGTYVFESVDAGNWGVEVIFGSVDEQVQYGVGSVSVSGAEPVEQDFTLPGVQSVEVRLQGFPLTLNGLFKVVIYSEGSGRLMRGLSATADSLLFEYMPLGLHTFYATIGDASFTPIQTTVMESTQAVVVEYEPPAIWRLDLQTSGDAELPESVRLLSLHANRFAWLDREVAVEQGRAELEVFHHGTHTVQILAPGFAPRGVSLVATPDEETWADITLEPVGED